jgi:hypothetical protein
MEGSRIPLVKWAVAIRLLASADGVTATRLAELIRVSYKTALALLKKLRKAISDADAKQLLKGHIHFGTKSYGFMNYHPYIRHPQEHPVFVAGAFDRSFEPPSMRFLEYMELVDNGKLPEGVRFSDIGEVRLAKDEPVPSYVKLKVIPEEHLNIKELDRPSERTWIYEHVGEEYSTVKKVPKFRYSCYGELPRLFQRAKSWIDQTFHGIGRKYLQHYLDEFCFRYNAKIRSVPVMDELAGICMQCLSLPERST